MGLCRVPARLAIEIELEIGERAQNGWNGQKWEFDFTSVLIRGIFSQRLAIQGSSICL